MAGRLDEHKKRDGTRRVKSCGSAGRGRRRRRGRLARKASALAFALTMAVCACLGLALYLQGGKVPTQAADAPTVTDAPILTDAPVAEPDATDAPMPMMGDVVLARALSAGPNNTAVIQNGRVQITGDNTCGQCDTEAWPDVIAVALGNDHAVGLTESGEVVYAGSDALYQCELDLQGVAARSIAAGPYASYAVLTDGSVRFSGSTEAPLEQLAAVSGAVDIAAAQTHVLILKGDGTVAAYGDRSTGACDVNDWRDITMIGCGYDYSLGLDSSGQVWFAGNGKQGRGDIAAVNDAVAIAAGSLSCYAVRRDGTVAAAGSDGNGQLEVADWRGVASVAGGYLHVAALTDQGELLMAGRTPASE